MQELRLVAVSEDGTYAVLVAPGHGGRFALPIDDRLRVVVRGQFSRLAQYEIEVERPLRPKEIQDRIRAGETAEEIADAAGVPVERVRRFEGPVLAERAYRAQEAQGATVRRPGESGPGPRLGEIVGERLSDFGADPDDAAWDSRKRPDGLWQVQLMFTEGSVPRLAEWVFDPRRKHISPADDTAARLCLPEADLPPAATQATDSATATVTPIGSRINTAASEPPLRAKQEPPLRARAEPPLRARAEPDRTVPATKPTPAAPEEAPAAAAAQESGGRERPPARKAAGRSRRSSVPSWDEIMFGTSRQPD